MAELFRIVVPGSRGREAGRCRVCSKGSKGEEDEEGHRVLWGLGLWLSCAALSCVALLFQDAAEAEKPADAESVPKAPKAKKTKKAIK